MKITLTKSELTAAIRQFYPVAPGYVIKDVSVDSNRYSDDGCTIELVVAGDGKSEPSA